MNENGYEDSERALGVETLFEVGPGGSWIQYISNAIKGKELFEKDIDYAIVKDDSGVDVGIGIIDSFTGRVLEGRRWSDGLHQSIEAKEKIAVSQQSQVIAKVTYQVSDDKKTHFFMYLLIQAGNIHFIETYHIFFFNAVALP